jgi:hypothetical protein
MFILDPDIYRKWVTDWKYANDSIDARASLQEFFTFEDEEDMEENWE